VTALEFDLESSLVEVLHSNSHRSRIFGRNAELLIFPEVQMGATIPDLVIVRQLGGKRGTKKVRLTLLESWIVGELLAAGRLREDTITRRLFTRTPDVKTALKRLKRTGVVRETRVGTYSVEGDFCHRFKVHAVEAKLSRWRAAVEQAKTYMRFSDRSFVALPASVIARNHKIAETCEREGVGLIAVRSDRIELRIDSGSNAPNLRDWTWLLAKTGCLHV
jgi:hypothetical protein